MTNKNGFFVATKGAIIMKAIIITMQGLLPLLEYDAYFYRCRSRDYTRQTFSSERYSIWTMQSNYHNLPMVNGVPQQFGSEFRATDVHFDPRRMYFSANIATAYPAEANVKKWVRSYQWERTP